MDRAPTPALSCAPRRPGVADHDLAAELRRAGAVADVHAGALRRSWPPSGRPSVPSQAASRRPRASSSTARGSAPRRAARIGRGQATFWQGFSEPDAGSDLLSLKTEATRRGDEYVIRGHKIWSSHAGIADYGLVLARTSPSARRSQGLSMFVVDNATAGLDIRPIRSLTGEVYHYEVFLDEVARACGLPPGNGRRRLHPAPARPRHRSLLGRFYKAPMLRRILTELVRYANVTPRGGAPLARDPGIRRRLATSPPTSRPCACCSTGSPG